MSTNFSLLFLKIVCLDLVWLKWTHCHFPCIYDQFSSLPLNLCGLYLSLGIQAVFLQINSLPFSFSPRIPRTFMLFCSLVFISLIAYIRLYSLYFSTLLYWWCWWPVFKFIVSLSHWSHSHVFQFSCFFRISLHWCSSLCVDNLILFMQSFHSVSACVLF